MVKFQNLKAFRLVKNRHELATTAAAPADAQPSASRNFRFQLLELIILPLLRADDVGFVLFDQLGQYRQTIRPSVGFAVTGITDVLRHHLERVVRDKVGLKKKRADKSQKKRSHAHRLRETRGCNRERFTKRYCPMNLRSKNTAPVRSQSGIVARLTSVVAIATCVAITGLPPYMREIKMGNIAAGIEA